MRIAFCGPRGTGKTTLAEYLVQHHGFTRCSLAAPIKRIITECPKDSYERYQYLLRWAAELFPERMIIQARFATEAARVLAAERDRGRRAQLIGTDVGRALDQDVWIRYLLTHLPDGPVAVDDVRFVNVGARAGGAAGRLLGCRVGYVGADGDHYRTPGGDGR